MRFLLTGATGLIGKEVGKKLVEAGHEVSVVSRHVERARMELPFPARLFTWLGHEHEFPLEALAGVDGVIHLAGEPVAEGRWTQEKKRRIYDSRVIGTRKLVAAMAQSAHKPRVFVHGSAIGFYGDRNDEVVDEGSSLGEGFLAEVVRDWEAEAQAVETLGVRLAVIRTGIVLSARGGAMARLLPLYAKGLGGQLSNGQQWMSWIQLDDIVGLFIAAAMNESFQGIYNGTAPEPARNHRFSGALAKALGRPEFLPVPSLALKIVMGEGASAVLASARVLPKRIQEQGIYQFRYPDLHSALESVCAPYRTGQHELVAEQWIPRKPEEVFPFFCDETNLEKITPPFLNFHVVGKSTEQIQQGTLIDYRLSLHGVPFKWRSEIEEWEPNKMFVDQQLSGPYRQWHHTHEFIPMAGGTLLRDRVLFRLPLGWLGDAVASWKVVSDVQAIFSYRRKVIHSLYGEPRP